MTNSSRVIPPPPNEAWRGIVDTRISEMYQVLPPVALTEKFPTTEFTDQLVEQTRQDIHNIFNRKDDRLVVISWEEFDQYLQKRKLAVYRSNGWLKIMKA